MLAPRLVISETALAVGLWLAKHSADGLPDSVEFGNLAAAFPELSERDLEEACYELKHLGLASCSEAVNRDLRVRPHYDLFWAFDPTVFKTSPTADAVELAARMLTDASLSTIPALHQTIGWERRRLNPAVALLMPLIDENRIRPAMHLDYPALGFVLNSEDRFRLRRFIEESRRQS